MTTGGLDQRTRRHGLYDAAGVTVLDRDLIQRDYSIGTVWQPITCMHAHRTTRQQIVGSFDQSEGKQIVGARADGLIGTQSKAVSRGAIKGRQINGRRHLDGNNAVCALRDRHIFSAQPGSIGVDPRNSIFNPGPTGQSSCSVDRKHHEITRTGSFL
jgi:hypothetical protein